MQRVPSFAADYGAILRMLLPVTGYRLKMGKKLYRDFLIHYLDKAEQWARGEAEDTRDQAFRNSLCLFALLQYTSGDFGEELRVEVLESFSSIFTNLRDDGRTARKLLAALNVFLLSTGLNLTSRISDLHASIQEPLLRMWMTTRDRELKETIVLHLRILLKLFGPKVEDTAGIHGVLSLVQTELDQTNPSSVSLFRDDQAGILLRLPGSFLQLASDVLLETSQQASSEQKEPESRPEKRRKTDSILLQIQEKTVASKIPWQGLFCMYLQRHGPEVPNHTLLAWAESLQHNLGRILAEGHGGRNIESPTWVLRCIYAVVTCDDGRLSCTTDQGNYICQSYWDTLTHWIQLYNSMTFVDEAFAVLASLITEGHLPSAAVSNDFWKQRAFREDPTLRKLQFVAAYFSRAQEVLKMAPKKLLKVRENLLDWAVRSLNSKLQPARQSKAGLEKRPQQTMCEQAIIAIAIGLADKSLVQGLQDEEFDWWTERDEEARGLEEQLNMLSRAVEVVKGGGESANKAQRARREHVKVQASLFSSTLLEKACNQLSTIVDESIAKGQQQGGPASLLHLAATLTRLRAGILSCFKDRPLPPEWTSLKQLHHGVKKLLEVCLVLLRSKSVGQLGPGSPADTPQEGKLTSNGGQSTSVQLAFPDRDWFADTHAVHDLVVSLQEFVDAQNALLKSGEGSEHGGYEDLELVLVEYMVLSYERYLDASEVAEISRAAKDEPALRHSLIPLMGAEGSTDGARLPDNNLDLDLDLDVPPHAVALTGGRGDLVEDFVQDGGKDSTVTAAFADTEKLLYVQIIVALGTLLPVNACDILVKLLQDEQETEVCYELVASLCRLLQGTTVQTLPTIVAALVELEKDLMTREHNQAHLFSSILALIAKASALPCTSLASSDLVTLDVPWDQLLKEIASLTLRACKAGLPFWQLRIQLADIIVGLLRLNFDASQVLVDYLLPLLRDSEYRVRLHLADKVDVLFEPGSEEAAFEDVCDNLDVKLVTANQRRLVTPADAAAKGPGSPEKIETALTTLGDVAASCEFVEYDVVFMLCAHAALYSSQRTLVCAILERLASRLGYDNLGELFKQHMPQLAFGWVVAEVPFNSFLEISRTLLQLHEAMELLDLAVPAILPPLLLFGLEEEIREIAQGLNVSVPALLRRYFPQVFSSIWPMVDSDIQDEKDLATAALQDRVLSLGSLTEGERNELVKKKMVTVVGMFVQQTSATMPARPPRYSPAVIQRTLQTVVDGFTDGSTHDRGVLDRLQTLRPDRVFNILLKLHHSLRSAKSPRHRKHYLSGLHVLLAVLDKRATVPSTFRYIIHILLETIDEPLLLEQCCLVLSELLDKVEEASSTAHTLVLADQLQTIVSRLVSSLLQSSNGEGSSRSLHTHHPRDRVPKTDRRRLLLGILHRLIPQANPALYDAIKKLDPFPELPEFASMRELHARLRSGMSLADELVQFAMQAPQLPPALRLKSLRSLCEQLSARKTELFGGSGDRAAVLPNVVAAAWKLVRCCSTDDDAAFQELMGRLFAAVGVWEPQAVAFHVPPLLETPNGHLTAPRPQSGLEVASAERDFTLVSTDPVLGVHPNFVREALIELTACLVCKDVETIDIAARIIQGILATEKGHEVYKDLLPQERMYLESFHGAVNSRKVEDLLRRGATGPSPPAKIEDSALWRSCNIDYDEWIGRLVLALLQNADDPILRLCQAMVLRSARFAELAFPHVLGNLAAVSGAQGDAYVTLSSQMEEHILGDEKASIRAVQVTLGALNSLRRTYVQSRMVAPGRRDSSGRGADSGSSGRDGSLGGKAKAGAKQLRSDTLPSGHGAMDPHEWQKVYWLQIDYLTTAKAALRCGAVFTALLYVEQWCEASFGRPALDNPDFSDENPVPLHEYLLLKIYSKINEPDGIYAVARTNKAISQLAIHKHEGNWSKVLEMCDLLMRTPSIASRSPNSAPTVPGLSSQELDVPKPDPLRPPRQRDEVEWNILQALHEMGCLHTQEAYWQSLSSEAFEKDRNTWPCSTPGLRSFAEMQYEAAWGTGKWDMAVQGSFASRESSQATGEDDAFGMHASRYSCLTALMGGDFATFRAALGHGRERLVAHIANTSAESTQSVYPSIVKLQVLNHLAEGWDLRWPDVGLVGDGMPGNRSWAANSTSQFSVPSNERLAALEANMRQNIERVEGQYDLLEPLVSVREALLRILQREDRLPQYLCESARIARKAGRFSYGDNALQELKQVTRSVAAKELAVLSQNATQTLFIPSFLPAKVEEAKLFWAKGQRDMAVSLARYLLDFCQELGDRSYTLCLTSKWLAETRSTSSRVILENFAKALEMVEDGASRRLPESFAMGKPTWQQLHCATSYHLAHFTDGLYKSQDARIQSEEFQAAERLVQRKEKERAALYRRYHVAKSEEEKKVVKMQLYELDKQLKLDKEEAARLEDDCERYLELALRNYQKCLQSGSKYDIQVVFRIVALWFKLWNLPFVNEIVENMVKEVPSRKFLPLVYQIASRMSNSQTASQETQAFQAVLLELVTRMASDHPFHTVYQLLALANGDRVKEKQSRRNLFVVDMDKKRAAEAVLRKLGTKHGPLLAQMRQLVELYIKLAELETAKEDVNKQVELPRDIRSVKELDMVPILTSSIPVDELCEYRPGSFPHFQGFVNRLTIMTGINAPKVVECLGSDGRRYKQLAKSGNDDLRQDAVMEQFFGLVNSLLEGHAETRKRELHVRIYKVVPCTPSAGVLEWVDGTVPLGHYLLGSSKTGGAHARYGGEDWSFLKCREHMSRASDKRAAFQKVCENFRPVMRHFFSENFPSPSVWFEKRLAYTRSVAASSMVGYVIGLGDRHSMNILLDEATAEVIHIDLGVAFDQGLMLKTPERVPFRLTRDIVDGMGVCGVEGVLRRCCEATLSVMRANKEALLTIIEVFIHDPLYKWALSPLKALRRQQGYVLEDDIEDPDDTAEPNLGNQEATRALLRVKQKLDGYEEGEMRSLQGQVQQLIQDAQDQDRLCGMFPGWGAWL